MCVVYLLSHDTRAEKKGGRIVLTVGEKKTESIPIAAIEQVVMSGNSRITQPAVNALLKEGIGICHVDKRGYVLGVTSPANTSSRKLIGQLRAYDSPQHRVEIVRSIIKEKLINQYKLLLEYNNRKHIPQLKRTAQNIKKYMKISGIETKIEKLRGLEGIAAREYFEAFSMILPTNTWKWQGRHRRPPKNEVNAMLSFTYALLEKEVRMALAGTGFAVEIGFLHENNDRKDSLVYDVMELFRSKVADRFVLTMINRACIDISEFNHDEQKGYYFTDDGMKKWLAGFEKHLEAEKAYLGGISCREYIRRRVNAFVQNIVKSIDSSCVDEEVAV